MKSLRLSSKIQLLPPEPKGRLRKEVKAMQWELIIALVIAIPIILFPAAFVWYLNLGWIFYRVREAIGEKKATREKEDKEVVTVAR